MEDASRLDDSGEGTLERPMRQPLPPPRYLLECHDLSKYIKRILQDKYYQ